MKFYNLKEEQPKDEKQVFAYSQSMGTILCQVESRYSGVTFYYHHYQPWEGPAFDEITDVTHWAYLPKPKANSLFARGE